MSRKLRLRVTDAHGKTHCLRGVTLEIEVADGAWLRIEGEAGTTPTVLHLNAVGEAAALEIMPLAPRTLRLRTPLGPRLPGADAEENIDSAVGPAGETMPVLSLTVQKALSNEEKRIGPRKHQLRRWASAALLAGHADVTVRLVGEDEGRKLNREYRGKDYATNVLTFVYDAQALEGQDGLTGPVVVGDLVLCVPVLVREAAEQGKAVEAHFAHLLVHGMLHLQGHTHENEEDTARMESIEVGILTDLGYPDPYA